MFLDMLRRLAPIAVWIGFGGAALVLVLALVVDNGMGQDVQMIASHDPSTIALNRELFAPGDAVAEIYGNPLSAPVRVVLVSEDSLFHPMEDPHLTLLAVDKSRGENPLQVQTVWLFAKMTAAGLLALGFAGVLTPVLLKRRDVAVAVLIVASMAPAIGAATDGEGPSMNGFDLAGSLIDIEEIHSGGPPRDGIPSIDQPRFVAAADVDYLQEEDIVIGVLHAGQARAYPTRILVWHEIVNDDIGGKAILVTYCPLCGTSMVFERSFAGASKTFGVSGLLYRSDVLMYDRESESLWSQLRMESVAGPARGTKLAWLPSIHTTWKTWRAEHPESVVLSTETGFERNYGGNAYASYFASDKTMFPVPRTRDELRTKEWVVGVLIGDKPVAFPVEALSKARKATFGEGDHGITVSYDPDSKRALVKDAQGVEIPSVLVFWFAWQAFYPKTALWAP